MDNKTQRDRRTYIGGADVAAIIGVSPYKTAVQVWMQKNPSSPSNNVNAVEDSSMSRPMRMGQLIEPIILQEYLERVNETEEPVAQHFIEDPEYPFLGGTLDAYLPHKKRVIEIKRTLEACKFGQEGSDQIPLYYLVQVAWYSLLSGAEDAHIAVLFKMSDEIKIYHYMKNNEIETSLRQKMVHFWHAHVLKDVPPEIQTQKDVISLFRGSDTAVVATEEIRQKIFQLKELKTSIGTLEKEADALKLEVMKYMKEASILTDDHFEPLVSWRPNGGRPTVDVEKLKQTGLYDQYIKKSTPSRTFLLKI